MDASTFEYAFANRVGCRVSRLRRFRSRCRKCGRKIGRCDWRNASEIRDKRMNIGRGHVTEAVIDGFAHRPRRGAAVRCVASRQIITELPVAPCADAGPFVGADIEGVPPPSHRAAEFISVVECKGQIAWRWAFPEMRERFGYIRAPVPFWTLRRVGLKPPIFIEER